MDKHSFILILIMAIITMTLRFLPFVIFKGRKTPDFISYLGGVLPYSIMAMLIVYCLKGINFLSGSRGIPEILACIFVVLIHLWKNNTLLSVGFGTVFYMVLVQIIFV